MILLIPKKRFGSLGPIFARWTQQTTQIFGQTAEWSGAHTPCLSHEVIVLHIFHNCFFAFIEDVTLFQQALQDAGLLPAEPVFLTQECPLIRPFLFVGEDGGIKGSLCLIPATIANPTWKEVRHYRRDRFLPVNAVHGYSFKLQSSMVADVTGRRQRLYRV